MEASRPQAPLPRHEEHRTNWRQWLIAIAVLLLLILVIQNSQKVEVHFFFADTHTPLIFALLIAAILGALVGWLLPRFRRSRKEQKSAERH
jgi:uncharacterized integral membrane protein